MSSDWIKTPLGKIVSLQRGHDLPTQNRSNGMVPIMGSGGITGFHDKATTKGPGVVIGRSGVGSMGVVSYIDTDYWALNTTLYVTDFHGNNERFIYYLFSTINFRQFDTGSAQASLNRNIVYPYEVSFPKSREIQDEIAATLSSIDDRITLLRETNTILEAIAQALFKSWFVDFDPVHAKMQGREPEGMDAETAALFPDSFEESELGLVPKGWRAGALKDCCLKVESGGTPKRNFAEYWNGSVSWLTSGEVRSPIVFDTNEKITELGVKESSAKIWPVGTTVVAMYGATAGEVCLLTQPTTANQACCGLIPKSKFRAYLFFCTRLERKNLASKSSGSAQQNLNKGLVSEHEILIPSQKSVESYENVAGILLDSWIENERKAQTLAQLRDTLLPRLISGQLRLPEAEVAITEGVA